MKKQRLSPPSKAMMEFELAMARAGLKFELQQAKSWTGFRAATTRAWKRFIRDIAKEQK